jgi:hypothetical protein
VVSKEQDGIATADALLEKMARENPDQLATILIKAAQKLPQQVFSRPASPQPAPCSGVRSTPAERNTPGTASGKARWAFVVSMIRMLGISSSHPCV